MLQKRNESPIVSTNISEHFAGNKRICFTCMVASKLGSWRLNRVCVKYGDTIPPCLYNKNMQMRKVLLVHISSSGCCNTLVTMLNYGDFWLSILFHSRVFHTCRLVPRFPLPRFQRPQRLTDKQGRWKRRTEKHRNGKWRTVWQGLENVWPGKWRNYELGGLEF